MPTFITNPATDKKEQLIKRLRIKEIKAFWFSSDGQPLLDGKPAIIEKYNAKGNLIESYSCWEGSSEVRMTTSADERGRITKTYCYDDMEFHTYDSEKRLIERRQYNEKGRIREWVHYEYENPSEVIEIRREFTHKDKCIGRSVRKSDERGNTLFESFFDENNEPIAKNSYLYDDAFRLMRTIEWGVMTKRSRRMQPIRFLGMLYSDYRYEYDVNGNLVKKLCSSIDETIDWSRSEFYSYDNKNRRIEESGFDEKNNSNWKLITNYDLAGNLISSVFTDANGKVMHSKAWRYDDNGLVSQLSIENREDDLRYRYVYSYICY